MRIRASVRWLPKRGNSADEYEDAFWPADTQVEGRTFHCALADGATETSFAGCWAQLLTCTYGCGRLGPRRWRRTLAELRAQWKSEVGRRPLPWYAEEKARQGAFSSLIGLRLVQRPAGGHGWSSVAIGDSCLFLLRDGQLELAFPLHRADAFDSRPYLLSSVPGAGDARPRRVSGELDAGDSFVLATDALARWLLASHEAGDNPWDGASAIASAEDGTFAAWVDDLRDSGHMRNDDVTLMTVQILD